jgi:hypothetical protein
MRGGLDYYSHTRLAALTIEKLATASPKVLACMHVASWEGDGASMLLRLGRCLGV